MKVIDLLNKIANEEEMPKKIIVHGVHDYEMKLTTNNKNYMDNNNNLLFSEEYAWRYMLNDEIEIIEEPKKIEKLSYINGSELVDLQKNSTLKEQAKAVSKLLIILNEHRKKLNEIIDYINKGDSNER